MASIYQWHELTGVVNEAEQALQAQGQHAVIPYARDIYDSGVQIMTLSRSLDTEIMCMRAALIYAATLAPLGREGWSSIIDITLSPEYFVGVDKFRPSSGGESLFALVLTNHVVAFCLHDSRAPLPICRLALQYFERTGDQAFAPWYARVQLVLACSALSQYGEMQRPTAQRYANAAAEILAVAEPASETLAYARYLAGQGDGAFLDRGTRRMAALGPHDIFHYRAS